MAVVLLGVIAVITVYNVYNKQTQSQNRAKVKKAMATYETMLNKVIIENQIKTDGELVQWADADEGCANVKNYFKITQTDGNNPCQFKTSDKVWWDVSNIERPMIAIDDDYLVPIYAESKEINYAFYMVGRFDEQGILRINDNNYEQSLKVNTKNIEAQIKLWTFISSGKYKDKCDKDAGCSAMRDYGKSCSSGSVNAYNEACYTKQVSGELLVWGEDGKMKIALSGCDASGKNCKSTRYITDDEAEGGHSFISYQQCNKDAKECKTFNAFKYTDTTGGRDYGTYYSGCKADGKDCNCVRAYRVYQPNKHHVIGFSGGSSTKCDYN